MSANGDSDRATPTEGRPPAPSAAELLHESVEASHEVVRILSSMPGRLGRLDAFAATAGPRIEAISRDQQLLREDVLRELRGHGDILRRVLENQGELVTRLDQHETDTVARVARVEGRVDAVAQHTEAQWQTALEHRAAINANPAMPDLEDISAVHNLPDLVGQHLDARELQRRRTDSERARERRNHWVRWTVAAVFSVAMFLAGLLFSK
jgi:hypothetical protein